MFDLPPVEPGSISNLSIDSVAKIQFTIRSQPHPLRQLEVADLKISSIMEALEHNWLKSRKSERSLMLKQHKIESLEAKSERTLEESIQLENYQDELAVAGRRHQRTLALVRDARMELAVAIQERERILAQNPQFQDLSYAELQQSYSHAVFYSSLAKTIAVKRLSHELNIPEEVVSIFADLDAETTELILEKSEAVTKTICSQILVKKELNFDLSDLTSEQLFELKSAIQSSELLLK